MQVKKLILALATVIAAPSAFAVDLSTGVTADNIIYVTGATAQTKGIAISVGRLCGTTNPLITLTDGLAVPVGKGWKCNTAAGTTYPNLPGVVGPFVVLKNEGGSLTAITPLRNGSTISQLDLTNCTVTGATGTCANPLLAKPGHIGFSDVSQKIFAAKNQLVAQTAGNTYVPDVATGSSQGFGVVVSPALYTLLQADQATAGIPSLSKSQYASLMTQTSGFWNTLLPNGTAHAALPLTLDRRSGTSGTQASAELFFLENPCAKGPVAGSATPVAGTAAGQSFVDGTDTLIVKQAASSDAVLADAASATAYVIGVVSLENAQPASSWKFVAIDGVHPGTANAPEFQKKNLLNGRYAFAYETVLFKSTKAALGAAILNNINDFSNAFVADLGVGLNLATSNGLYGDPLAPAADFLADTGHYSRSGNECATPLSQF